MKITFMGDVHSRYDLAIPLIEKCPNLVIQIGDWGFGFPGVVQPNPWPANLWCLRGNHDSPKERKTILENAGNETDDYGFLPAKHQDKMMPPKVVILGGGYSSDKHERIPGVSWWADEELSWHSLGTAICFWVNTSAKILVTHEPPANLGAAWGNLRPSRTSVAIQEMIDARPPSLHIFGHLHKSISYSDGRTTFRCLDIMEMIQIDTDDWR